MKKLFIVLVLTAFGNLMFTSCNSEQKKEAPETAKVKETPKVEEDIPQKESITDAQALAEVKKFISQNKKKYDVWGTLETSKFKSGDYDGDKLKDFFFTEYFHEDGSDYNIPVYFYRSSINDKIVELMMPKNAENITCLEVSKIENNLLKATFYISDFMIGDRQLNTDISIDGNKIIIKSADIKKTDKLFAEIEQEYQMNMEAEQEEAEDY